MTRTSTLPTAAVRVDHHSAVHLAAATAREVARERGLPGALPDQAAVIASELASNLDKHASNGTLYIQPTPLGAGVEIMAADRGPGMPELERCLADGYTTAGTLGVGLGAVSRLATHFTIRTGTDGGVGAGTWACARLTPPGDRETGLQDVGSVCLAVEGEEDCGDARAVVQTGETRTAAVVDGLGHGPQAAEAAQVALRSFLADPDQPLPDLLTAMNRALRRTRGAAVGLLRLGPQGADYCGIGNVRALTLSHEGVHHRLTGQPGVVGWSMPRPRSHGFPVPPGATVVLYSDGIDCRWAREPSRSLLRLPPSLLSAALAHAHRRLRDDATVLATRPPQTPRLP
ncbi:SpoIIE family protein phosphatase [Streptomyces sp. NA02950]|uniref:SpoIIE family protein phosphatase n=1 Tax=Streptomyces sp. NA02950 TaxID=2742137 RepID=UPI0020CADE18|nr:SpoIIE family protein phosphatase [Streptomyces sp. NA02950]